MNRETTPNTNRPYIVALTGGIASGKTLISDEFSRMGVPVIDTDVIAHALVEPGQQALKEIEREFGPDVIDGSGRLKRRELRSLIFADPDKRDSDFEASDISQFIIFDLKRSTPKLSSIKQIPSTNQ